MARVIVVEIDAGAREVQDRATELAQYVGAGFRNLLGFRRAWIRDLGRLARTHQDDWAVSAYAVQTIRQLRGQLPIE